MLQQKDSPSKENTEKRANEAQYALQGIYFLIQRNGSHV